MPKLPINNQIQLDRTKSMVHGRPLPFPKTTLHKLLENQALKTPKALALKFGSISVDYQELQNRIDEMAKHLWHHGVRPGQIIAISLERSPDLIVSMFAVLKCGASYIPIDTAYPKARLELMMTDSAATFLIHNNTHEDINQTFKSLNVQNLKDTKDIFTSESVEVEVSSEAPAYIIYTSGSTGKPKGVVVTHNNTINLVYSMGQEPGISSEDKIFAVTTISFDAMVMETFLPLLHGASIVLVDEDTRRDGDILLKKALDEGVTVMWGTPSIWQILLDSGWENPLTLKALIGGEPVPLPLAHKLIDRCEEVWNIYGPTETTVCCLLTKITKDDNPIVVGLPVANTAIYLLDENGEAVDHGEVGEIVIGGAGVSQGYLNRPELTSERFLTDNFQEKTKAKLYYSGDLGKLLPNGKIQCLGRRDFQVKVRGHRIELGEIETVLNKLSDIKKATVVVNSELGESRLVAYMQTATAANDSNEIREQLNKILPDYMIPSIFMWVDDFPLTSNGKVDKDSLPSPKYERPDSAPPLKKPRTKLEKELAKIWGNQLLISELGIDDNFFEMGGTSLLSQKVATLMRRQFEKKVPVSKIYQYPTIAQLSKFMERDNEKAVSTIVKDSKNKNKEGDVAIIGMAGRFPGANSIDQLWEVLKNGEETISFFKPEELDGNIPDSLKKDPLYVAARGVVPSAKEFDAQFFGINPKLAEAMDPQQRLFLEIAWEVLEQSGHLPKHFGGSIGVYAGTGTNTYYKNNILPNGDLLKQIGHLQANTVNEKDYISSRTAYHLNLRGPAVSIHSACSTSLLAIAEAAEAIRNGQCDIALAGGSSLTSPINSGHLYQEGSILSSDGHCRTFDAEAKGTVFSDGAGVVLLKDFNQAKEDGDLIYGLIKGVGINNDGGDKGSFTAPSVEGQADAIRKAIQDAKISPSSISYLEAHGTATPVGDPIEIEGLKMAFGAQEKNGFCAIGSIKSNMGHLTAAAGVAGLIKTILAMNHRQIPPSIGYSKPNPSIDFENSPFVVNDKLRDWKVDGGVRRAGISSFGVGGTNVHVIVEEYLMDFKPSDEGRPLQLLPWSAKSEKSLDAYGTSLGNFLDSNPDNNLADVEFSLNTTRDSFAHRGFVLAKSVSEAREILLNPAINKSNKSVLKVTPTDLVFLFPGQGAQFLQMGRALYDNENVFREAVDHCAEILKDKLETDIRNIIYPKGNLKEDEDRLKDTRFTQPALFVIEYALAQLWMSWGVKPTMICGHSIGEFVGAHLAGIFSLEDALHLITVRGRLVSELPGGSMLSVRLEEKKLRELLPKNLSIAAINSDKLCVVSGADENTKEFAEVLKQKDIPNKLLATSHAFHSAMMEPVLEPFRKEVGQIKLSTPKLPIISTVTGKLLTNVEAQSPDYWTDHLRATVKFSDAIDTMVTFEDSVLLEVGPGQALTTLARQKKAARSMAAIASLRIPKSDEDSYYSLLNGLGQLWLNGIEPDWSAYYQGQSRQKMRLPSYQFDRKPCWVEPVYNQPQKTEQTFQAIEPENILEITNQANTAQMRLPLLLTKIFDLINESSGVELDASDADHNFMELGLDSLILTQIALTCKREFNTPITFRQLNEDYSTPSLLAAFLDENLPADAFAPAQNNIQSNGSTVGLAGSQSFDVNGNPELNQIAQQLQMLSKQVAQMQGNGVTSNPGSSNGLSKTSMKPVVIPNSNILSEEEKKEHKKPFGASPRIERQSTDLNDVQKLFLENLIERYNNKTKGSKNYSQENREQMADPRVVSGFKPLTKELIYPIVVKKSKGNRLWDLDGNEYIDALNGFGSCFFGHQPDFIKKALNEQIENGYEVGPQHPLAGEVCDLLCEFTDHDRAALCNTGSEAVLGAMRIARTVTGRSLIIAFSKSYHGINDEGIVRGSKKLKTFPAAAGILPEAVQNMLILEYGTEESLRIIKERALELAAVLIEPVQSRRPEFLPLDFLKEVREITKKSETALIFDEVITGFRVHPGGFQAKYDIKADLATYGKVIGGGLSIGAILGKKEYMDALDGGFWQYGDNSYPEVGVTYFAGTFVRHPLALAASKASLLYMKDKGENLQNKLATMTEHMALRLNLEFAKRKLPIEVNHFSSLWRMSFKAEIPYSELLFVLLREKGIHIWDGFPCFLTEAYSQEDIEKIERAIWESIDEMKAAGFFDTMTNGSTSANREINTSVKISTPPVAGARLGRDKAGNPAWFVPDSENEGNFLKIEL